MVLHVSARQIAKKFFGKQLVPTNFLRVFLTQLYNLKL